MKLVNFRITMELKKIIRKKNEKINVKRHLLRNTRLESKQGRITSMAAVVAMVTVVVVAETQLSSSSGSSSSLPWFSSRHGASRARKVEDEAWQSLFIVEGRHNKVTRRTISHAD